MNKKTFIEKITEQGIDLKKINVYIDSISKSAFSIGTFQENDAWIVYTVDEKNDFTESYRGKEDIAFNKLYRKIYVRLDELDYVNDSISKDIIKITKKEMFRLLEDICFIEEWEKEDIWKYLLQDFKVLNEVKFFAVKKSFVPEKDAYHIQGYTAETIFQETCLDVLGAFNYLIYLKEDPRNALSDLKKGLPRK